jgi:hypothetical protein
MARLLIDTHVLLWWLDGDKRLVRKPRQLVQAEDNDILVSAGRTRSSNSASAAAPRATWQARF